LQTAATNSGPAAPAIGADNIGFLICKISKRHIVTASLYLIFCIERPIMGHVNYVSDQERTSEPSAAFSTVGSNQPFAAIAHKFSAEAGSERQHSGTKLMFKRNE
jgi:hypothetical protein